MTLRIGSLCSGYGGLDEGVRSVLGGDLAWVADNAPGAAAILAYRFPSVPNHGDIRAADWAGVEPVDILTGGFPCQPVSQAGRHKGISDERWLFDDITEAVGRMVTRPRLLVFENVAGLLSANGGDAMAHVVQGLASLGYVGRYGVLRASDAGAPHGRARVFILAWLAADASDGGRHELDDGSEPRAHGPESLSRRAGVAGDDRGGYLAATDSERDRLEVGAVERHGPERQAAERSGGDAPANTSSGRRRPEPGQQRGFRPAEHQPGDIAWGPYEPAIRRWEAVLGRRAPRPTEPGRTGERLSPRFVEWMQGLPAGWVTEVPGIGRKDQLHALGNGVVPQQCALALQLLLPACLAENGEAA